MSMPLYMIKAKRKPGLSLIVRTRNEEKYLGAALDSMKGLTIPHEIVVVLHRCTDGSKKIAEQKQSEGLPITIAEYEQEISKAGYETLATPVNHPGSLPTYSNFLFSHANYVWTFNLAGDIRLSHELVDYLNNKLDFADETPTAVRIGCVLEEVNIVNAEQYLFNCLAYFGKHIYWEVPSYTTNPKEIVLDKERTHSISNKILKKYWHNQPWFMDPKTGDSELAAKYSKLVELFGPEPAGMARGSNPEADKYYRLALDYKEKLKAAGVLLYG